MVEPVKHPKVVLDRQIKPLTVHSTPPPEVDLASDFYSTQTEDDRDQWKWLVAGSVGSGTIDPSDLPACMEGIALIMYSSTTSVLLSQTLYDGLHYETRSKQFKSDVDWLLTFEEVIMTFFMVFEIDRMLGISLLSTFNDKLIPQFFLKRPSLLLRMLGTHILYWTPLGMSKIPEVWEKCGKPGGGLGKKLLEKGKKLLEKPTQPVLVPASNYAPIVDPKTATEALTATALLGIVGATILYILTFPESVAASIALPLIQPGKEDRSM